MGAAGWTVVAFVLLPVLYVASFGPACWIVSRGPTGIAPFNAAYRPLLRVAHGRGTLSEILFRYALFGAHPDWTVIQRHSNGTSEFVWDK